MKPLLVALVLTIVLTPAFAISVERDGTALFLSFEELREMLRSPTPPHITLPSAFQPQGETTAHESRIEREYRWGNGLGINSYVYPETPRRPLWGY